MKDFIKGFMTALLIVSAVILYLCFKGGKNNSSDRIVDTVFVDRIEYETLTDTIKETEIKIKYIENEKDNKLEYIDTISNDNVVVLFRKLIQSEQR